MKTKTTLTIVKIAAAMALSNSILQVTVCHNFFRSMDQLSLFLLFLVIARLMKRLEQSRDAFDNVIRALDESYQKIYELEKRETTNDQTH